MSTITNVCGEASEVGRAWMRLMYPGGKSTCLNHSMSFANREYKFLGNSKDPKHDPEQNLQYIAYHINYALRPNNSPEISQDTKEKLQTMHDRTIQQQQSMTTLDQYVTDFDAMVIALAKTLPKT